MKDKKIDKNLDFIEEYNKLAAIYDEVYAPTWPNGPILIGLTSFLKTFSGGNNILEIGVGTGNVAGLLYNLGYHNITGVDFSAEMIKLAKQKIPNLITIEQDVRETNYHGYDWIICVGSVLNRISNEDKKELFKKMYNEMDDKSIFFLSLRTYKYNYDFEENSKVSLAETKGDRFEIDYDHEWIAPDCYYGIGRYNNLKTNNELDYSYQIYVITENDLIELVTDAGFKHVSTAVPSETGYYTNVWIFKK